MAKKKKKSKIIPLALFCIIIVITISMMTGFVKINQRKQENERLRKQIKEQEYTNAQIRDMVEADNLELIEKKAREVGYGDPNGSVYIDIIGK